MSREKKFIFISLIIGLAAAMGFYLYMGGLKRLAARREAAANAAVQTRTWIVAGKDISARTLITADMLQSVLVPVPIIHPEAVTNIKDAVGRAASVSITKGEFLLKNHIIDDSSGSDLGFVLPAGRRAITIETSIVTGVGNLLHPGDVVDVLVYLNEKTAGKDVSFTLVRGLQVMATDQKIVGKQTPAPAKAIGGMTGGSTERGYASVTLGATPKECAVIYLAESIGKLRLVLHSLQKDVTADNGVVALPMDLSDKFRVQPKKESGQAVAAAPAPMAAPAAAPQAVPVAARPQAAKSDPNSYPVYVLRGTDMTSVSMSSKTRSADSALGKKDAQ